MNATNRQLNLVVNTIIKQKDKVRAFDQIYEANKGEANLEMSGAIDRIKRGLENMSSSQADYFIRAFYSEERSYRKSKAMNILVSYKLI